MTNFPTTSKITSVDEAKVLSLTDWQKHFAGIFFKNNTEIKNDNFGEKQIAFVRGYIISHISQDLGDLAESINENNPTKIEKYIGSIFAWLFALTNEIECDLSEIIWEKYPGWCRYCGYAAVCRCVFWIPSALKKGKTKLRNKLRAGESKKTKPNNLSGYIDIWTTIYGDKYRVSYPLSGIMYKLFEEHAEILDGLDDFKNKKIEKSKTKTFLKFTREIADFTSWLFALILMLEPVIKRENLPNMLFNKFGSGCKICKTHIPCSCKPLWLEKN